MSLRTVEKFYRLRRCEIHNLVFRLTVFFVSIIKYKMKTAVFVLIYPFYVCVT